MPNNAPKSRDAEDRTGRIRRVIEHCMRRRAEGETLSDEAIIKAHSDLMPELAEHLRRLRRIEDARRQAEQLDGEQPETVGVDEPVPPTRGQVGLVHYFGDYLLEREIGRGGMGVVYRARQVSLPRVVALKMMLAERLATSDQIERFHLETQAAAALDHPGIVPIFEVGRHEECHFFSMAFVDGESLAHQVQNGPLPGREAARYVKKTAEAIQYAHEQGVIHRDVKPANILIDRERDEPHVTDFGLAKQLESDGGLTASGQIMGTPGYMPPEQAVGNRDATGAHSDVYALGATLYHLLTGRPPFQAENQATTILQSIQNDPVSPRELNPIVHVDLETICLKCLEKSPAKRYSTAAALAEELGRFLKGHPIHARPVSRAEHLWRWCKRNPAVATLLAAVLVTLALGVAVSTYFAVESRIQAEKAVEKAADAERNAAVAERERKKEVLQRQRAEATLYSCRVSLAQQSWSAADVPQAIEYLDVCPRSFRHWEWYYLYRVCHLELVTYRGHRGWSDGNLFSGPLGWVKGAVFSSDGRQIVSVDAGGKLVCWDATTGKELSVLEDGEHPFTSLAASSDGNRIVAASFDGVIKIWDANSGFSLRTLRDNDLWKEKITGGQVESSRRVWCVAINSTGSLIASGGVAGVRVWDAASGTCSRQFSPYDYDAVTSVAFSHDGKKLAAAWSTNSALPAAETTDIVTVWDIGTGDTLHILRGHTDAVLAVSFHPNDKRIVSASSDGTARIWDLDDESQTATITGHTGPVRSVAYSPCGTQIATGGADETIQLWNAETGEELLALRGHSEYVASVRFCADGKRIVSSSADGTAKVWDTSLKQISWSQRGDERAYSVAFSPDGRRIVSGGWYGEIKIWDAIEGSQLVSLRAHRPSRRLRSGRVHGVGYSPDGKKLISCGTDKRIVIWDAETGSRLRTLTRDATPTCAVSAVAISPDGKLVAAGGWYDGAIPIWELDNGKKLRTLSGHIGEVRGVAFSPDGVCLASAGADKLIRVWNVSSGKETLTLKGHDMAVNSVAFGPGGQQIASAGFDKTVRIWDAYTGVCAFVLRGHGDLVNCVAFTPDGKRVISSSKDNTVKLWDTLRGLEVLTLRGSESSVTGLAVSPDGARIAAAGKHLTIWDSGHMNVLPDVAEEPKPAKKKPEAAKSQLLPNAPQPAITPFDADQAKQHQQAWAKYLGVPGETSNSIGMKLKLIPAGEFMMGPSESDDDVREDENPPHEVRITKPFYLGVYAVTQAEYEEVMGKNPSPFSKEGHFADRVSGEDTSHYPVHHVPWHDAVEFCKRLSTKEGKTYRLPTEAEWEYACRAGTTTPYSFGDNPASLKEYAWYTGNSDETTHPVGQKKPNAWGLHDMYGNVAEWCADWYAGDYYGKSAVDDPMGPDSGTSRVLRGGAFGYSARDVRSAYRIDSQPVLRCYVGFRVARTYP